MTLEQPAVAFTIHQRRQARFDRLLSPIPAILLVQTGHKVVTVGAHRIEASAGMFLALPEHTEMTIENVPVPGRPYEARAIAMGRGEFDAAYAAGPRRSRSPSVSTIEGHAALLRHFERTTRALCGAENVPPSVARLMVHQLVVWLAEEGLVLPPARPPTVSDRVRMLVSDDLPGEWTAGRVGRALAMSEATLRRRLAEDGRTFRDILAEQRMATALSLLQTTTLPVSQIAEAVGYQSASRFAARFRTRFGVPPSDIRASPERE